MCPANEKQRYNVTYLIDWAYPQNDPWITPEHKGSKYFTADWKFNETHIVTWRLGNLKCNHHCPMLEHALVIMMNGYVINKQDISPVRENANVGKN